MNEFDKTNEQDVSKGNKRRSFLKKSATGAVVISLPAKSVWGACSVSGSLSGNLSTNTTRHDCLMPTFSSGNQGTGPLKWQNLDATTATDANANDLFSNLASKFGVLNDTDYATLKAQFVGTVNAYKGLSLKLPVEHYDPSPTVGSALTSGDPNLMNLAAVFLNASFGLYSDHSDDPLVVEQLVNDIFLFIYTNMAQGNAVSLNDSDFGFTDPHAQNTTLDFP